MRYYCSHPAEPDADVEGESSRRFKTSAPSRFGLKDPVPSHTLPATAAASAFTVEEGVSVLPSCRERLRDCPELR